MQILLSCDAAEVAAFVKTSLTWKRASNPIHVHPFNMTPLFSQTLSVFGGGVGSSSEKKSSFDSFS